MAWRFYHQRWIIVCIDTGTYRSGLLQEKKFNLLRLRLFEAMISIALIQPMLILSSNNFTPTRQSLVTSNPTLNTWLPTWTHKPHFLVQNMSWSLPERLAMNSVDLLLETWTFLWSGLYSLRYVWRRQWFTRILLSLTGIYQATHVSKTDRWWYLWYNTDNLQISNIDIFSNQFYPPSTVILNQDITLVQAANEVYLAEEYDWAGEIF